VVAVSLPLQAATPRTVAARAAANITLRMIRYLSYERFGSIRMEFPLV
jgi:hypothetical protein